MLGTYISVARKFGPSVPDIMIRVPRPTTRDSEVQIIESLSSFPGGHSFTVLAVTAEPCIILAAKKVTPAITERSCLTAVKLVKKSS